MITNDDPGADNAEATNKPPAPRTEDQDSRIGKPLRPRSSHAVTDPERKLLALMTIDENMAKVVESDLRPEVFEDPYHRIMFTFMCEHWRDTGKAASMFTMETEYPSVPLPLLADVGVAAQWCVAWLRQRFKKNQIQTIAIRAAHGMEDDPDGTLFRMRDEADLAIYHAGLRHQDQSEPIPLTTVVAVPAFPVDALPKTFGDMVRLVAESTQTDPAMSGTALLSVLSACQAGYGRIEIRYGWQEPLCLYTATIAGPGERKSAVQQAMVRPLLEVEKHLATRGSLARLEAETRKQIATRRAETSRQAAARDAEKIGEALQAAQEAAAIEVPAVARLVADDVTPEAAGSLLAEQGGRLAIISAEGGIFDIIAGRYSTQVNLDVWLKGHSGDMVKVDRKGRPPEYIEKPALTLGLMIQPSVLSTIAANHEFRGRGLLARFLYAMPVSKVGHRQVSTPIDQEIEKSYSSAVEALALAMIKRGKDTAVLTLSEDALQEFQRIEMVVESTLAKEGELATLIDWGAKYMGALARIAGILHLAEHGALEGPGKPVSSQTIQAAEQVGQYFKATAINTFAEMGNDKVTTDAVYLLERIQHLGKSVVSERDLQRTAQRFKTKDELGPAIHRLVNNHYLVKLSSPKSSGGRPGSQCYRIHASVLTPHDRRTELTKVPNQRQHLAAIS